MALVDTPPRPPGTCGDPAAGRPPTAASRRRLVDAARQVLAAAGPSVALPALAGEVGVGPHHLSRVFHAETGQTLSRYRNRLPVRRALERIDAGADNLAQVAADLGFADHAHLTRAVRAELGCTPTQVRQQLLQIRERSSHQSSNARSPSTLTRSSSGPRRP